MIVVICVRRCPCFACPKQLGTLFQMQDKLTFTALLPHNQDILAANQRCKVDLSMLVFFLGRTAMEYAFSFCSVDPAVSDQGLTNSNANHAGDDTAEYNGVEELRDCCTKRICLTSRNEKDSSLCRMMPPTKVAAFESGAGSSPIVVPKPVSVMMLSRKAMQCRKELFGDKCITPQRVFLAALHLAHQSNNASLDLSTWISPDICAPGGDARQSHSQVKIPHIRLVQREADVDIIVEPSYCKRGYSEKVEG